MKKFFTMILSVALLATMVVGGTLATDGLTVNPLTFLLKENDNADISIKQTITSNSLHINETLDEQALPAVYENICYDEVSHAFADEVANVIDYQVSVTNNSNQEIYVRTLFAFETLNNWQDAAKPYLHFSTANGQGLQPVEETVEVDGDLFKQHVVIEVGGRTYKVYEYYYGTVEAQTTAVSLQQFCFDKSVSNEHFNMDGYHIMVQSHAIAAADDSEKTEIANENNMKKLFGAVTSDNHPWQNNNENDNKWTGKSIQ